MIRRKLVTRLSKRKHDPSQLSYGTDCVLTLNPVASTIEVTASQNVVLDGKPALTVETRGGPLEVESTGPNTFTLTYDGTVASFDYALAARDPAIRTATGGYAQPLSGTFP